MSNNRTTELLLDMLYAFLVDYQNILKAAISEEISEKETIDRQRAIVREHAERIEQAIAATLGSEREAELVRAMEDVLRHSTDTVWVSEIETLVDRMVSLGVYGCEVYEGARPWEVD